MPMESDWPVLSSQHVKKFIVASLWALLASAMLIESDVYRYITIMLVAWLATWHRKEWTLVTQDWLAVICYGWAGYVMTRFLAGIVFYNEYGSSEWLYLFPVFFPAIGAALYLTRDRIYLACLILVMAGFFCLLLTLDIGQIFSGQRVLPLFHKNPIHAGVGSGMLLISVTYLLVYSAETGRLGDRWRWLTVSLCGTTAVLSLLAILGAHSKGAWVAIASAGGFAMMLCVLYLPCKKQLITLSSFFVVILITALLAAPVFDEVAGSTFLSVEKLTWGLGKGDIPSAMQDAIEDPSTPNAMRERLMIWYNAIELFEAAPLYGAGNTWLRAWHSTSYANVGHTLLHNGFAEIAVRHGLLGLMFFTVFSLAAITRLAAARREGLIATSTFAYVLTISFYFLCTIATNSNNRLAIGESFFILAGGSIFAVTLMRKHSYRRIADESTG